MNSKLLLVMVALIVVFGAFIFLANKNTSAPSSTNPNSTKSQETTTPVVTQENQVTNVILGDSGFVPKDITVKKGTKMIWINKSGKSATVNSVDHPTHSLYPFLNLGEFPSSSTLEVVFDKAGKYSYHDHLNAVSVGTVTVQ